MHIHIDFKKPAGLNPKKTMCMLLHEDGGGWGVGVGMGGGGGGWGVGVH